MRGANLDKDLPVSPFLLQKVEHSLCGLEHVRAQPEDGGNAVIMEIL